MSVDIDGEFSKIRAALGKEEYRDYIISRGEYLNAKIMAEFTGFDFIDAEGTVFLTEEGRYDEERTKAALSKALSESGHAVIPGFYGTAPDGKIKTFSRGGSDITGAIVSAAAGADLYENWTDVSGLLMADPRIVKNPLTVPVITYRELRELAYMGAAVMHEDTVFPVEKLEIPINIRNTERPEDCGTMIVKNADYYRSELSVSGISGKTGCTTILIEKSRMSEEPQLRAEILKIFEERKISVKNILSSIDSLNIIVDGKDVKDCRAELTEEIWAKVPSGNITVTENVALIAVVGRDLSTSPAVAVRVLGALANRRINVNLIDHGAQKMNMMVGVSGADYEAAVQAIYTEFAKVEI